MKPAPDRRVANNVVVLAGIALFRQRILVPNLGMIGKFLQRRVVRQKLLVEARLHQGLGQADRERLVAQHKVIIGEEHWRQPAMTVAVLVLSISRTAALASASAEAWQASSGTSLRPSSGSIGTPVLRCTMGSAVKTDPCLRATQLENSISVSACRVAAAPEHPDRHRTDSGTALRVAFDHSLKI